MIGFGPLLVLLAVAVVPFLIMLYTSLTDFSFSLPDHIGKFVGLANFRRALLSDPRLLSSLLKTVIYVAIAVPLEFILGLSIATLLQRTTIRRTLLMPGIALPVILAPVTVGVVWRLLLNGDYGPIGYLAHQIPAINKFSILGSASGAFFAAIAIDVWQWTPFFVIVLLAGLDSLPTLPREAAAVDGATDSQIFRTVTLPMLRPTILVALLFRSLDCLKEFDKVFVLTHGGPASGTEFISLYTWIVSFEHGELGYGSAITVILFIVVVLVVNLCVAKLKFRSTA